MFNINGTARRVNRVAYELWKGPIPDGLHVLHSCDNSLCVNPDHLRVGTNDENVRDRHERGRWADMKGSNNSNAKLTVEDVKDIKILRDFGFVYRELAEMYGVTISCVYKICVDKSWVK